MRLIFATTVLLMSMSACGAISDSQALRIAHAIGDYAEYTPSDARKIDYEVTDSPSHPAYAGYITIQLMANGHAIFDMSINEDSGQVVDFNRCIVFEYPVIRSAEMKLGIQIGKRLSYAAMMGANGCERYHVLRRPGDEAKTTLGIPTD